MVKFVNAPWYACPTRVRHGRVYSIYTLFLCLIDVTAVSAKMQFILVLPADGSSKNFPDGLTTVNSRYGGHPRDVVWSP